MAFPADAIWPRFLAPPSEARTGLAGAFFVSGSETRARPALATQDGDGVERDGGLDLAAEAIPQRLDEATLVVDGQALDDLPGERPAVDPQPRARCHSEREAAAGFPAAAAWSPHARLREASGARNGRDRRTGPRRMPHRCA